MRKEFKKFKRIKKRGSFLKNRLFLFGVGIIASVECFFYVIVFFPFIQIQDVKVEGNKEISENQIKGIVIERLWGKFFFLPTASIFLTNTHGMQDALLKVIPELESADIQRRFPNSLIVVVRERVASAIWCQEFSCVEIDREGIAFKRVESALEGIMIYGQGQPIDLKETAVKKEVLDAILEFAKEAKRQSLFFHGELSFEIISNSEIHAHTGEGWDVYFTNTQDLSWQNTKLQTVLKNKILPERRKDLEYIDVRFGDQAYLKYH